MPEDDFKHVFVEEALESLQQAEEGLLAMEKNPRSRDDINSVFRALHTIKGGAGMVDMEEVGNLAHHMENVLTGIRQTGGLTHDDTLDLLFSGADLIKQIIESDGACIPHIQKELEETLQALEKYESRKTDSPAPQSSDSDTCEFIKVFDESMKEKINTEEQQVYLISVTLSEDCLVKIARVYLVLEALDRIAEIIKVVPTLKEMELDNFDSDFSVLAVGEVGEADIKDAVDDVAEIEGVDVSLISLEETDKFFAKESLADDEGAGLFEETQDSNDLYYYRIDLLFNAGVFKAGTDPLLFFPEIHESGRVLSTYINTSRLPDLESIEPDSLYLSWVFFMETRKTSEEISNIFIFAADDNEIRIENITDNLNYWFGEREAVEKMAADGLIDPLNLNEALKKQKEIGRQLEQEGGPASGQVNKVMRAQKQSNDRELSDSIRVSTAKLESILDSVAELIIAQSRLKEMAVRLKARDRFLGMEFSSAFEESDKIIRRLQEYVMNASMIPIGGTFIRFQRMARDLAKELGKEIELNISGRETELDKKIIEQIIDPLKHLIRNSVGHGIETPEEREAAGKPRKGVINLNAFHREGNVVIEISDDGRGIDEEKVLAKAKERNLVEDGENLSREAIQQLIFIPGLSTVKELSDVSGRGVGLDVVNTNIQNLSGHIDLYSEKNRGTRFTVKLPLTMAIIDGMMIRVGKERFIIPLSAIIEFIKAAPGDVRRAEGKGSVLRLRDELIPYIGLYRLFTVNPDSVDATDGILVILREDNKKLALLVDEIIGQEQVVIKSIKDNMEQVAGVAGATIMGDGRVAVILDITSLFRLAKEFTGFNKREPVRQTLPERIDM